MKKHGWFTHIAAATARIVGTPAIFIGSIGLVLIWAAAGPLFDYSNEWQLVINTGTTIITFLMVFLIQATQNREWSALNLKIDELVRAVHAADNRMLDLEELELEDLEAIRRAYLRQAEEARR